MKYFMCLKPKKTVKKQRFTYKIVYRKRAESLLYKNITEVLKLRTSYLYLFGGGNNHRLSLSLYNIYAGE